MMSGSPSIVAELVDEADVAQPHAGVLERQAAALGELDAHALEAGAGDAREEADAVDDDGEVRHPADGEVQRGVGAPAAEGADHRERREVDAARPQAGAGDGREDRLDHLAAGRDDDDALARAVGRVDDADRLVVEHGGLERHGELVGGDVADGRVDLRRVGHRRDVDAAHDDLRVRDPDAHVAPEALVLAPEARQGGTDGLDVGDLAVAHDADREVDARRALEAHDAVDGDLGGNHAAGLDVQPDNRPGLGSCVEREGHVQIEALIGGRW